MSRLNDRQRQRIITRHRNAIARHGYRPNALFWSSREIQYRRFEVLAGVMQRVTPATSCPSLLDVGCGFGDLKQYLDDRRIAVDYHGIDLSPDMVRSAGYQVPGIRVGQGDLFDLAPEPGSYDFVFLSGALNEVVDDPPAQRGDYARETLRQMYRTCRYATAFNLLDARHEWTASRGDLQSFDPGDILAYCRTFADEVRLVEGYLENDFTVYLMRKC